MYVDVPVNGEVIRKQVSGNGAGGVGQSTSEGGEIFNDYVENKAGMKGFRILSTEFTQESENLIPFPYTETSKTIDGITFTVNEDKSITVNGEGSEGIGWISFYLWKDFSLPEGDYQLTGCPQGGDFYGGYSIAWNSTIAYDEGSGCIKYNHLSMDTGDNIWIQLTRGVYYNNLTFRPKLIRLGDAIKPRIICELEDSANGLEIGDIPSLRLAYNHMDIGSISTIEGNNVTISLNDETSDYDASQFKLVSLESQEKYPWYNTLVINKKPEVGNIIVGINAHAEGLSNEAYRVASHAEGWNNIVYGDFGHAEGQDNIVGYCAHSEGRANKATGEYAHAEGRTTIASAQAAHTEGYETTATELGAHAEGNKTVASGLYSHAEGQSTEAINIASHSEGYGTKSQGKHSHAEGSGTVSEGEASHAEGGSTQSIEIYSHSEGELTIASGRSAHAEGESTEAKGYVSHAEGYQTIASGIYSHAEGSQVTASNEASHAEGYKTSSEGLYSHAEGQNTVASNLATHAEGYKTKASGEYAHAEGWGDGENKFVTASGKASHAEGINTTASATCAHAEGSNTTAKGAYSHAEGNYSMAQGKSSHAEGEGSQAIEVGAHAEGYYTQAKAKYSHTSGQVTIANLEAQTVVGKFNNYNKFSGKTEAKDRAIYVVGNGTGESDRRNAFEVYEDGHAEVQKQGATSNSVVTKGYFDAHNGNFFKHLIEMNKFDARCEILINQTNISTLEAGAVYELVCVEEDLWENSLNISDYTKNSSDLIVYCKAQPGRNMGYASLDISYPNGYGTVTDTIYQWNEDNGSGYIRLPNDITNVSLYFGGVPYNYNGIEEVKVYKITKTHNFEARNDSTYTSLQIDDEEGSVNKIFFIENPNQVVSDYSQSNTCKTIANIITYLNNN